MKILVERYKQAQKMLLIPWGYIADWKCIACGRCCKAYSTVLTFQEWLKIIKNYGVETTTSGLNKLFVRRKSDGSCVFLYALSDVHLCGLQHMKPKACMLWPFKVLSIPQFGYASEAEYYHGGTRIFVYADSNCSGLIYGKPTWGFTSHTLKEFIEIALGLRSEQYKTTGNIDFLQSPTKFRILGARSFREL